jgi:hypothetical protein
VLKKSTTKRKDVNQANTKTPCTQLFLPVYIQQAADTTPMCAATFPPHGLAGLADSQKVVVNSPRALGGVGRIYVAIQQSSLWCIGRSGPVVVESDKRALSMVAEGMKGLLCGDNSGRRRRKCWTGIRATSADCRYMG